MDSMRRFTPERLRPNIEREVSPHRDVMPAFHSIDLGIPTVSTPSMPTPLAGHRILAGMRQSSPGRLATSTMEIAASIRRGEPPPSDLYLQKVTDDLINEKRCRRAEREEYDLQLRKLEERIMSMDDAALRADTEVEKSVHLKQKVKQLSDHCDGRKHEISRLQDELVSVSNSRERDRDQASELQVQQNLKIETLTRELSDLQGKCHQLTHSHITQSIIDDVQGEEALEQILPLVFGITAIDIPSVDIVKDIDMLSNDQSWKASNAQTLTFTGTTKVIVADGLADDLGIAAGDVILRVQDTEVASVVHLQILLLAYARPEAIVQFRTGNRVKTATFSISTSPQLTYPDVQRLCQLTGGMSVLLSDYKEHINSKAITLDSERHRRLQIELELEKERQQVVDTRRLLDAAQQKEISVQDRTMDVQLVGVNARLTQEKKVLTLRLSRAQEDKQRLELELKKSKEITESLQSQRMQQWERSVEFEGEKVPPPREPTPEVYIPPPTPFDFQGAIAAFSSVGAPEQQIVLQCLAQHATRLTAVQARMTAAKWKVGSLQTDRQRLENENSVLKGTLDDLLSKIDSTKTLEMGMKQRIFELETSLKLVSARNPSHSTNKNLSPRRPFGGLPPPPPIESYSPSTLGHSICDDIQEVEVIAHHSSPRICIPLKPCPPMPLPKPLSQFSASPVSIIAHRTPNISQNC